MTDPLPMFDDPIPPQEAPAPPKKPRQKPVRKRKAAPAGYPRTKAQKAVVKRRKKRAPNKPTSAKEEVFLSPEVYKTIRTLVDLSSSERGMVMAIVKGLTNGRDA